MHLAIFAMTVSMVFIDQRKSRNTWYFVLVLFVCPLIFTLTDTVVLIAALRCMWVNFKDDPSLITNEKIIGLHVAMLFIFFLIEFATLFCIYILDWQLGLLMWTSYHIGAFLVTVLLCVILWQLSGTSNRLR